MGYNVLLGLPGPSLLFPAVHACIKASEQHTVALSNRGLAAGNFNGLWFDALNAFEEGQPDSPTHFAMLHSDVFPVLGWIDILIEEMDRLKAALVSVAIPIKDNRGAFSCGIGDPHDSWSPFRRWTSRELMKMPETFRADDVGYPGGITLHNNGCWVADLRLPEWRAVDEDGNAKIHFSFPETARRAGDGKWMSKGESEDWFFSRKMHEAGLRNTYVTRKVPLLHRGVVDYPNHTPWGQYQNGDEDTAPKWRTNGHCKPPERGQSAEEFVHGPEHIYGQAVAGR